MIRLKKVERYFLITLLVLFGVGLLGYTNSQTRGMVHATTEVFLYFTGILALSLSVLRVEKILNYLLLILVIFVFTLLVEIIGVKTGVIFGAYQYGELFVLKVANVPIIIGINWTIAIFGAYSLALRVFKNYLLRLLFIPLLIFIYDYLLEPVAMVLDYWQWEDNVVPVQNYITWMLLSLLFSISIRKFGIRKNTPILEALWIIQLIFFFALHLILEIPF